MYTFLSTATAQQQTPNFPAQNYTAWIKSPTMAKCFGGNKFYRKMFEIIVIRL